MNKLAKSTRENKLKEQHGRCFYCGIDLSLVKIEEDHILPFSKYRNGTTKNFCLACSYCNNLKRDLELNEFKKVLNEKYPYKLIRGMFYFEFIKLYKYV
jgi:5-methylcytosine-specific restriction endonuclease McrA